MDLDAIVVLGCRVAASGQLAPPAARRAATAARGFLAGVAPRIVVSGGRRWGSQIEARAIGRALVRAGVPEGAVIEELCSLSTRENAIFSAAVLRSLGARHAAVVTCPWHMARALENFRAAGVDARPLPTGHAEAPLAAQVYQEAHELVCRRLDARAARRAEVLSESAEAWARSRPAPAAAAEPLLLREPEAP